MNALDFDIELGGTQSSDSVPVLLTAEQLAAILHKSPKSLERWRQEGVGPRWIRCGRTPLYRLADVTKWLEANTVTSTSEGT